MSDSICVFGQNKKVVPDEAYRAALKEGIHDQMSVGCSVAMNMLEFLMQHFEEEGQMVERRVASKHTRQG